MVVVTDVIGMISDRLLSLVAPRVQATADTCGPWSRVGCCDVKVSQWRRTCRDDRGEWYQPYECSEDYFHC